MVMRKYPVLNQIGTEKVTRGTETSKYPEEEKETSIPSVAASERGRAQTGFIRGCGPLITYKIYSQSELERSAVEGKSPVDEIN